MHGQDASGRANKHGVGTLYLLAIFWVTLAISVMLLGISYFLPVSVRPPYKSILGSHIAICARMYTTAEAGRGQSLQIPRSLADPHNCLVRDRQLGRMGVLSLRIDTSKSKKGYRKASKRSVRLACTDVITKS